MLVKGQGVVQRIDPATNSVIATIETGGHQGGDIMVGGGFVWATYRDGLPLVQINPETKKQYSIRAQGSATPSPMATARSGYRGAISPV